MGVDLLLLRGILNNVTTSFSDATFTGLVLKKYSITFAAKVEVSCYLSPVSHITNSSGLNSQIISTNYCYQLLLKIVTEARNLIVPGFGEGMEKGAGTTPLVVYFSKPQNILKLTFSLPPSIYSSPEFRNTYYIYTLSWPYRPSIRLCCPWSSRRSWPPRMLQPPLFPSPPQRQRRL